MPDMPEVVQAPGESVFEAILRVAGEERVRRQAQARRRPRRPSIMPIEGRDSSPMKHIHRAVGEWGQVSGEK